MAIVTRTQALKKLYKAVVGSDTSKNDPTKIISELADNWPGGGGGSGIVYITPTVIDGDSMVCFDLGISYNELLQIIGSGGIPAEIIENDGAHTIAMLYVYGYDSGQSAYVVRFADDPSAYSAQDPDDNLMFCISK